MKAYIISVVLTSIIAFVASSLTPVGRGGTYSPFVRLVCAFALICVMISPLTSNFLESINVESIVEKLGESMLYKDYDFYEENMVSSLSQLNASTLEQALSKEICEKFGIEQENVSVKAEYTFSADKTEFSRILVLLSGKAIFKDPKEIEEFVYGLCEINCDCALN